MGLETADSGRIFTQGAWVAFEDFGSFSGGSSLSFLFPYGNVQMALKEKWKEEKLAQAMTCLLPKECLTRPVSTLSGDEAAHRHSAGRSCAVPYACNG